VTRKARQAPAAADLAGAGPSRPDQGSLLAQMGWCVLAGTMIFLSFPFTTEPDSNWWPLGWFAFVPFLWALRRARPRRALWLGALCGLVTNFGGFWWVSEVLRDFGHMSEPLAWSLTVLNAGYQGLCYAIFAWLYASLRRDGRALHFLAVAALFTLVEFVFPLIFPWFLGNGQYRFLPAIQIADITGVMGITFVMVALSAALYGVLAARVDRRPLPWRPLAIAAGLVAATLVYGGVRIAQVSADMRGAETFSLGMVEADIGIWEKQAQGMSPQRQALTLHRNLLKHQTMSRDLAERGADLIVWPESSYFPLDDPFIKRSDRFALGLSEGGALLAWRHDPEAGFAWQVDRPRLEGRFVALAAAREDAWAAVGDAGRILVGDARAVTAADSGVDVDLHAVALATAAGDRPRRDGAAVDVWAVGEHGTVLRGRPDVGFVSMPNSATATLRSVDAWSGRRAVAVGDGGAIVEIDPAGVRVLPPEGDADLYGVWVDREGERAVAVGAGGVVLERREGGRWRRATTPARQTLRHVVGDGDAGWVRAAGERGLMLRRDREGAWTREDFPSEADVTALSVDGRGTPLAADRAGHLFAFEDGAWAAVESAGLGVVRAIAPLPYVQVRPLPRDVRYIWQARTPLPALEDFDADPFDELQGVPVADRTAVQRGFTTPILFGGITWEPAPPGREDGRRTKYNTAIMLDEVGRVVGTYDKVYLLVFGEYLPFGETFPGLYDLIPQAGRFTPGRDVKVFDWGPRRIGVMICYEDILPKFTGRLAAKRPNIIINVTNDAWFGYTSEPHLHLALSVFRAVENRLVLARATNTGVSAVIDPTGRVVTQTRLTDPETTLDQVPLMEGRTFYGAVGDLFTYLMALALAVYLYLRRRGAKPAVEAAGGGGAARAGDGPKGASPAKEGKEGARRGKPAPPDPAPTGALPRGRASKRGGKRS